MDTLEKVETYFAEEHPYKKAIGKLRQIALKTPLEETFKWMFPTYTLDGKNVLAICKFKNHFGLWFFNGVFLNDPLHILENAQEGKTKAMRHWKFSNPEQINEISVLEYIMEAVDNQKNGKILIRPKKKIIKTETPILLVQAFKDDENLKHSFEALPSYKQKGFSEYLAQAKQKKTEHSRLKKIIPMILKGEGLNAKYR